VGWLKYTHYHGKNLIKFLFQQTENS